MPFTISSSDSAPVVCSAVPRHMATQINGDMDSDLMPFHPFEELESGAPGIVLLGVAPLRSNVTLDHSSSDRNIRGRRGAESAARHSLFSNSRRDSLRAALIEFA